MSVTWTAEEVAILRKYYEAGGAYACMPLLPGRDRGGIMVKANRLGLVTEARQRQELPETPRTGSGTVRYIQTWKPMLKPPERLPTRPGSLDYASLPSLTSKLGHQP